MWFKRTVDRVVQTENQGDILKENPQREFMNGVDASGDMSDSEAKEDETSSAVDTEEELMHEIGYSGDLPSSAPETDEIRAEGEAELFLAALVETVPRWFRDYKESVIFIIGILLFFALRVSITLNIHTCEINVTSFCHNGTTCKTTVEHGPHSNGSYRILLIYESLYNATEQPGIDMAMDCRHQECKRNDSGYRKPETGQCFRSVRKCGYNTTECHTIEAAVSVLDSCADCWTLLSRFECDDGNTTEILCFETTDNPYDPRGSKFVHTLRTECDHKVFSGEAEAVVAEGVGNGTINASMPVSVKRKSSGRKEVAANLKALRL